MLSVICPIFNEEKYIARCIDSIIAQDYPHDDMEIIFADGMSSDSTRNIVNQYIIKHPYIKLIDNPLQIVPSALNIAIDEAKGDIIMRLDAHAEYPHNYFTALTHQLKMLEADNVGAICETLPINTTDKAHAIANVLSSKFGMGNSSFRIGVNEIKQVDTVPFGCWPRRVFNNVGKFDMDLIRNQDDEFNGRIIKSGGKIYLIPDIRIKYYARDEISKISKMFYQYGLFKPLVNKKLGSPATIRQFFPLGFVLGLIIGLIISLFYKTFAFIYIIGLLTYLVLAIYFSIKDYKNLKRLLLQVWVYFIVHTSYGFGYIVGLWKLITHSPFVAKSNR